jgi:hypothetical protein
MTSTTRSWISAALTALFLASGGPAFAQDPTPPPKDEGLDNLLKKLEDPKPEPSPAKEPEKDKAKEPAGNQEKGKVADKPKAPGAVAPKDQSLDSLLEKLGETVDKPRAEDKPPGGGGPTPPDEPKPPGGPGQKGEGKPGDSLKGEAQDLDEHLKALTGKKDPKDRKQQDGKQGDGQKGEGGENGPLDDVIKEMRDVEERLGQPDTGEDTRKKQAEIVKNLDTLIEQMNQSQSQSQAMKMLRQGKKPGQPQPGQGQQQGAMANGPPPTRPATPNGKAPVALDKDSWGHLPAQLREEMGNVFKEGPLPSRLDLIRLYYLSINKKSSAREE